MKKLLKILGIAVSLVILLIIAAIAYLAFFFDPNDYKDRIVTAVKNATGRELTIEGDLALTFFPWLGVEFGAMSLSNPAGFAPQDTAENAAFLRLEGGKGYVALLPLISKRIEIDEVQIDGLRCNLVRNADGSANWDFSKEAAQPGSLAASPAGNSAARPAGASGAASLAALAGLGLNSLSVNNANLSLNDRLAGQEAEINGLGFSLENLAVDETFSLRAALARLTLGRLSYESAGLSAKINALSAALTDLSAHISGKFNVGSVELSADSAGYAGAATGPETGALEFMVTALRANISDFGPGKKPVIFLNALLDAAQPDLALDISLNIADTSVSNDLYRFQGIALDITPRRGLLPPEVGPVVLRGNLDIAPATLDMAFTGLGIANQHASLEGQGGVRMAEQALNGNFTVNAAPAELLKALGQALPTADPKALQQFQAAFGLAASPNSLEITGLDAKLDESAIQGGLSVRLGQAIDFSAQIGVDAINIDRYLPPAATGTETSAAATTGAATESGIAAVANMEGAAPQRDFKSIARTAQGTALLSIGSLTAARVPMTDINVKLTADRGVLSLEHFALGVGGGTLNADGRADLLQTATRTTLNAAVANVDIGLIQRLALGKEYVSSRANGTAGLTAAGDKLDAIKASLTGSGEFSLGQGVLTGLQLIPQEVPGIPNDWMAKSGQVFNSATGTFTIADGLISNKDFKFNSPLCTIAGAGTASLPKNSLDYSMTISFGKNTHLPARLHGPLNDPAYSIDPLGLITGPIGDPAAALQKLQENSEQNLRELLESMRPGGSATQENAPQQESPKPGEVIQDTLRGIFNR